MASTIGGYFELELSAEISVIYPQALRFQSARAAFLALLRVGRPARVWMPKYICDVMIEPLRMEGIECVFYSIDFNFSIINNIDIGSNDWLLYVNYFGICSKNVDNVLEKFNKNQVILDNSQAFYSSPRDCLANIYSPRKFFGIPDGGLLITDLPVDIPLKIDEQSEHRTLHLIKRLANSPESGYADYQLAEKSLCNLEPLQMSQLTRKLLASLDYEKIKVHRNKNYQFLHEALGELNQCPIKLANIEGPLCYPFFTKNKNIKSNLISARIFTPTYWTDVKNRVFINDIEFSLVNSCIALPCDQRYRSQDLEKIVDIIMMGNMK